MSNGSDAIKAFDWLQSFLADVADVAQEVDSGLSNAEFVSAYDNGCMWDRSNSIRLSEEWLPKYVLRVYVHRQYKRRSPAEKTPYWGFFGIYLRPLREELLPEPVAAWGVVKQVSLKEPVDRWKPPLTLASHEVTLHFSHRVAWRIGKTWPAACD